MTTVAVDTIVFGNAEVEIAARSGDRPAPTISIVAYNGDVMTVPGWGPVAIDLAGLDAGGQIPLLADHDARVGGVVGHGAAVVRDGRLVVTGVVSGAGVAARQIIEMSKAGFAFQASVGVEPLEHERVRPGERIEVNGRSLSAARGFTLVKRGRLREVSITAVGADAGTSVAIAAASSRMKRRMDMDVQDQLDEAAVRADERERLKNIEAVCRGPSGGWGTQQKRVDELKASAISGEITVSALTAEMLNILRESRPKLTGTYAPAPTVGHVTTLEAALLRRMGLDSLGEKTLGPLAMEHGVSMRATHALDLCRAALQVTATSFAGTTFAFTFAAAGGGIEIADAAHTFVLDQTLQGDGDMAKLGPGTLALRGPFEGTYTGDITVETGTLAAGISGSLGNATRVTVQPGATLLIEDGEQWGSLTGGGNLELGAFDIRVGLDDTDSEFSGAITGSGVFYKAGSGSMSLTGNNDAFTGTVSVEQGTLRAGINGTFGASTDVEILAPGLMVMDDNEAWGGLTGAGGGMFNYGSSPMVIGCTFNENIAAGFQPDTGLGGGMCNLSGSAPSIVDYTFAGNQGDYGAGMHNGSDSNPQITGCTFIRNVATVQETGAGMHNEASSPVVTNCTFLGNTGAGSPSGCSYVGGMLNLDGSNPVVTNCVFAGNPGCVIGGMMNEDSWPIVADCTFSGNEGLFFGAMDGTGATAVNSIFWGNGEGLGEIVSVTATFCDIEGGYGGVGNINAEPLFIRNPDPGPDAIWGTTDDDYGDLRLQPGSPCIDAADNTAVPPDAADLDGNADTTERTPLDFNFHWRFVDDPDTADTGIADLPDYPNVVAMGAHEFQVPVFGDLDDDYDVDCDDFALFADCMSGADVGYLPGCDPAGFDADSDADVRDFLLFQQQFTGPLPQRVLFVD